MRLGSARGAGWSGRGKFFGMRSYTDDAGDVWEFRAMHCTTTAMVPFGFDGHRPFTHTDFMFRRERDGQEREAMVATLDWDHEDVIRKAFEEAGATAR